MVERFISTMPIAFARSNSWTFSCLTILRRKNTLASVTPDPLPITQSEIPPQSAASERQSSTWDIRNAPKNYIWLVIYQIGSAIFSFGAVWLITRRLGSEGYGGIVAIIAASQVAQVFVNWSSLAVVRFGVDEFIETEKIARAFWTRLIIVVINLALVLVVANVWFPPLAEWLKISPAGFWLVITHFVVTVFWIHMQMSLQGAKMPRVQGFLQMTERLLIVVSFAILIGLGRFEFFWVVISYIAVPTLMILIGLVQIKDYVLSKFSINRQFIKQILVYSAPLAPMALVGYFSGSYLDAVFVSKFLSTRDLGVYSVATQMNGIVLQLPTLANSLLITLFITLQKEEQTEKILHFFEDLLPTAVLVGGIVFTIIAFFGFLLLPLIFGAEFSNSIPPLWIMIATSTAALPVFFGYSAAVHAKSATFILMAASISAAAANVLFNFLLIPTFGLMGCAWATAAAYFVGTVTYGLLLTTKYEIPSSWLLLAMVPAIGGAFCFTQTKNAGLALLVCALLTLLISYFQRRSIVAGLELLSNLRSSGI